MKGNNSKINPCAILQVDISTMLEEAVEYVKFLQLQIKVRGFSTVQFRTSSILNARVKELFNGLFTTMCSSSALMKCGCMRQLRTTG